MQRDPKIWQQGGVKGDALGHMVPINRGTGGVAKDLINLTKEHDKRSILINARAHTRYDKIEQSIGSMLDSIAGDDDEHAFAMLAFHAGSVAELGLARAEAIQADSHLLVPSTLPVAPSYSASRAARNNGRRWPMSPKRSRTDGESSFDE